LKACEGSELYPVFVLDPWFTVGKVGANRFNFLLESLSDLDQQLRALKSRLYVVRGKPHDIFPTLFNEWGITRLTFEVDIEPYAKQRDAEISELAKQANIEVVSCTSHTLYDMEQLLARHQKQKGASALPPTSYGTFQKLISGMGAPAQALPAPTTAQVPQASVAVDDSAHQVPSLSELGYPAEEIDGLPKMFPGGETEALRRMKEKLGNKEWVHKFEKPKTNPAADDPATTVLSPYLKFGCLSPRLFYHELKAVENQAKGPTTKPPVSLEGQLLWREFYVSELYTMLYTMLALHHTHYILHSKLH
jgi:cryptochrome